MGSSDFEALNYDIFINLLAYLDVSDVVALSKCSKLLRQHTQSHQIWMELGRRLVRQGIPLPTRGFKTPDDLSSTELMESVVKADRIYRGWTSECVRATKMTVISEENSYFAYAGRTVTKILPITSEIVAMLLGQTTLIIWDVERRVKLAEYSDSAETAPLSPSLFSHEVDLSNKALYFLTHTCIILGHRRVYRIRVMKADFGHLPSDPTGIEPAVSFEELASFCEFSLHRRLGYGLRPRGGFLLNAREKRLCQVYAEMNILLFVVLDWDRREAAFIDTGILRIAPSTSGHRLVTFVQVYVCTWDASDERLILTIDTGRGTLAQHVYYASQFQPFLTSFDVFNSDKFDIDTIPVLAPTESYDVSIETETPRNKLASPAVHETAFQTPWHKLSGVTSPPACSRLFLVHLKSNASMTSDERDKPAPLRGIMFIGFPPSASFSLAYNGPAYSMGPRVKLYSVQYGALAWTREEESDGLGPTRSVRISRFSCPTSKDHQVGQDTAQVCTPLLPNGDPVLMDNAALDGLLSLSLDEVHGRLFLVYRAGKIVALHYG